MTTSKTFRLSPMTLEQIEMLQNLPVKTQGWTTTQIVEYAINHIAGHAMVDYLKDDTDATKGHKAVDSMV